MPPQVLGNELKDMCRKHNPVSRHRRIDHGVGAVEMDTGFGSVIVPQVRSTWPNPDCHPDSDPGAHSTASRREHS